MTTRRHNPKWKDNTRNERQARRRTKEREWLKAHGFTSWEALHTALMNGTIALDRATPAYSNRTILDEFAIQLQPELKAFSKKGKKS